MNRKPVLRTETLTERRLKRQLRRFMSLDAEAAYCAHNFCSQIITSRQRLLAVFKDMKGVYFQTRVSILYSHLYLPINTRQERILERAFQDVLTLANKHRFGFTGSLDDYQRVSTIVKQALHQTRRDKEMTE